MPCEKFLYEPVREIFLGEHDFFVKQAEIRIFNNFKYEDIEKAAKKEKKDFLKRQLSKGTYGTDVNIDNIAEYAEDHSMTFGVMLHRMKSEVILAILTSLYHRWEKNLRERIEHLGREFGLEYTEDKRKKVFWESNIDKMLDKLKQFTGWDVRKEPWYPKIDACRLLASAYKHGKGHSLDELKEKYPEYLGGFFGVSGRSDRGPPLYEDLWVEQENFVKIANAFREFWVKFP